MGRMHIWGIIQGGFQVNFYMIFFIDTEEKNFIYDYIFIIFTFEYEDELCEN